MLHLPSVSKRYKRWPTARFGDHVEIIDPNPSHRYPAYKSDGVPLVATQDFLGRDEFTFEKCKRVPLEVFADQRERCRFTENDVIFARKGILGHARRYGTDPKAFSHTIVIMKPRTGDLSYDFLLWLVRSDSFMNQISRYMNINSGVPTLGVKTLGSLKVWMPPLEEQIVIAEQAKSVSKAIDDAQRRKSEIFGLRRICSASLATVEAAT